MTTRPLFSRALSLAVLAFGVGVTVWLVRTGQTWQGVATGGFCLLQAWLIWGRWP